MKPKSPWEVWSDRAIRAAKKCDTLPDSCDSASSWETTLTDIAKAILKRGRVTPDQMRAVENIEEAIAKWLDR